MLIKVTFSANLTEKFYKLDWRLERGWVFFLFCFLKGGVEWGGGQYTEEVQKSH